MAEDGAPPGRSGRRRESAQERLTVVIQASPVLMKADEAASYLGTSLDGLGKLVAQGLPCFRPGGGTGKGSTRLFHRTAIEDWVYQRMQAESSRGVKPKRTTAKPSEAGGQVARKTTKGYVI